MTTRVHLPLQQPMVCSGSEGGGVVVGSGAPFSFALCQSLSLSRAVSAGSATPGGGDGRECVISELGSARRPSARPPASRATARSTHSPLTITLLGKPGNLHHCTVIAKEAGGEERRGKAWGKGWWLDCANSFRCCCLSIHAGFSAASRSCAYEETGSGASSFYR